ncbi:MAG: cytochrome c [Bdellovibrionaceae bacterium]|nr:cytochrome c [Pseudobdellovibrionaceae bacterium]
MRLFILVPLILIAACTKKPTVPATPPESGKRLYATHCTACHNPDPKKEGGLGPAVFGSSLELLERRLVHGDYPPGYKPKRDSKVMARLPFLKDEIPALHAYLNSP